MKHPTCFSSLALLGLLLVPRAANAAPALPTPVELSSGWQLQDVAKIPDAANPDAGAALSKTDYRPNGWFRATVPGTVLTTLVNNGVYPEPLYGENNRPDRIPDDLSRTSYWYRTTFSVPRSFAGKRVWLNFNGINYKAAIWVNGVQVGNVNGAFSRGIFDVTSQVNRAGTNALAVLILPPPNPGIPHEQTVANGTGRNGGILAKDGPTFLSSIGWDWIPGIRDRNIGIWQDVTLSATGPVTVRDPYVTSDLPLPRLDSADLKVQTTLSNSSDAPQTGVLTGTFGNTTFRQPITLNAGETRLVTLTPETTPALRVRNPRLWWPNGYGQPNLYALHLSFAANGTVSDARDVNFGIREMSYQVPGSENLTISVNGVPMVAKGGNWGMDEAMKRNTRARLDTQVRLHRDANFNMIRNWVGQSTSADFYDACDKYGIMLWDEMFQPNPSDGPNPDDVPLYLANVREKITRFRSHPSIAVWCARNEGFPPPEIDAGIQLAMTELDGYRLYQPSSTSGRGVRSGGPYAWREPRVYYNFSEPFKTEIGPVSVPTLETIRAMMPPQDWEVINDDWASHDMVRGAQAGDRYPAIIAQRYGAMTNLADFTRKAQMANYEAHRALFEGRLAKMFNPVTGVIMWMSNPSQPSFVWQIYSHDLDTHSSFYAVKKACEPIHIMMNQTTSHLMLINNTAAALSGAKATVSVYNLDGTRKSTNTVAVAGAATAATDLGEIAFPEGLSPVHFVKLELRDASGKLLSDNFYWRETTPDNFQALNTLPRVALDARASHRKQNGQMTTTVTLRNTSTVPALMTHLQMRTGRTNRRVLPSFYSDNYVSLLPGESKTIEIEVAESAFGGETPLVMVDGWNVSVKPGAGVAPNVVALSISTSFPVDASAGGTQISQIK